MIDGKIVGTLNLFDEERLFTYENGLLSISFDANNQNIKPLDRGILKQKTITGLVHNGSQFITFYIGDNNYYTGLSIKYFAQTTFSIAVKFYLIHSAPLNNLRFTAIKLRFENDKYRKFFGYYENHKLPKRLTKRKILKYSTIFNTNNLSNEAFANQNGVALKIYPYFALTPNYSSITLHSGFDVVYKAKVFDCEFAYLLFRNFYKTLKFLFYRQNIELGKISLHLKHKNGTKYMFEKIGDCFLPFDNHYEMENSDLNKTDDFGFIQWVTANKYLPTIFDLINKDELYLHNIPSNKKEKGCTSINSVSLDASAFEFEYDKLYGKVNLFIDLADRKIVKDRIKGLLPSFENDNQRTIANRYMEGINKPTLKMKNKKALEDFAFIMKLLGDKFGYKDYVEEISQEFKNKRNSIDHGLKNLSITNDTANAYYLERILIYSMQLKRIGMSDDEILQSVKTVFELFRYY